MNKTINRSLLSIGIISAAAFIGFGAIFNELDISIGTQAITAAFGALFVLLSTKFLMEQESETRVQGEKISKIFEEQLHEYKSVSDCMLKILQDGNFTLDQVHNLLDKHAILILIGEQHAIKSSGEFIKTAQKICERPTNDAKHEINEDEHKKLNRHLIEFLTAARTDLNLKSAFDPEDQQNLFNTVSNKQKRLVLREEVSLTDWKGINGEPSSISEIETFIKTLETRDLKHKVTRSQISFRGTGSGANLIYLNNFTKEKSFSLNFNASPDRQFLEQQGTKIQEFQPRISSYKNKYNLNLKIPLAAVSDDKLSGLFQVIDAFKSKDEISKN